MVEAVHVPYEEANTMASRQGQKRRSRNRHANIILSLQLADVGSNIALLLLI